MGDSLVAFPRRSDWMQAIYTKGFAEKSSCSVIGFSNRVLGCGKFGDWANYWNYSCFGHGFPFKIEYPTVPEHGKHVLMSKIPGWEFSRSTYFCD